MQIETVAGECLCFLPGQMGVTDVWLLVNLNSGAVVYQELGLFWHRLKPEEIGRIRHKKTFGNGPWVMVSYTWSRGWT